MIDICKIHGETEFKKRPDRKKGNCRKCLVEAVQKHRVRTKEKAVLYKGGKCQNCGYNKCIWALEFHHRNEEDKEFNIGHKGYTRSWEVVKKELDKCDLLCSNCHKEVHYGISIGS